MIKNPMNANHKLANRHTLYLGLTGSGKSQCLKQRSQIPDSGARVVLFDPSRDHPKGTHYFSDREQFANALAQANASGRGFRVGYDGIRSSDIHDWWCACVHAILDGKKTTYAITEELGRVSIGAAGTTDYHGWLLNEGRKYGLVYHATTQFPARISKDVYDNAGIIYFGKQPNRMHRQFAGDFGLPLDRLVGLGDLEFIRWEGGKVDFHQLSYQK